MTGPVAIVTANDNGTPHGTTVSSLASLSLTPAMISVALDNASTLLSIVRRTGAFGINILSAGQHEAAMRFASRREGRFATATWEFEEGLPSPDGQHSLVAVQRRGRDPRRGSHPAPRRGAGLLDHRPHPPLVYSRRSFGTHTVLPSITATAS
ncbi:flavin reductase family protein [Rhodococcus sp. NPDC127530]|uniref:flavin reductase family protein n=1 Tax=unclassified Rhodococcus (in: high G+C Gram-positive bacteria) TaxID=192944 RepID=UPI003627D91B